MTRRSLGSGSPRSLALFALLWTALLSTPTASAQTGDEARRIASEIHTRDDYADGLRFRHDDGTVGTFPQGTEAGDNGGEAAARRFDRGGGADGYEERIESDGRRGSPPGTFPSFRLPHIDSALLAHILQGVAIVALLVLVVSIVLAVLKRGKLPARASAPSPPPLLPSGSPKEELPWDAGDPDRLFAEGRLAEAILALLVQSLRTAGWRPETQRARTAREVFAALAMDDARRAPLGRVVRGAERVRFAGDAPSAELFQELSHERDALKQLSAPEAKS